MFRFSVCTEMQDVATKAGIEAVLSNAPMNHSAVSVVLIGQLQILQSYQSNGNVSVWEWLTLT